MACPRGTSVHCVPPAPVLPYIRLQSTRSWCAHACVPTLRLRDGKKAFECYKITSYDKGYLSWVAEKQQKFRSTTEPGFRPGHHETFVVMTGGMACGFS